MIAAGDVEAAWIAVLALLRTRLLALPDRLAPQLQGAASPAAVRDVLRSAVREALEELAATDVRRERDNDDLDPARDGGVAKGGAPGAEGADPAAGDDDQ